MEKTTGISKFEKVRRKFKMVGQKNTNFTQRMVVEDKISIIMWQGLFTDIYILTIKISNCHLPTQNKNSFCRIFSNIIFKI